MGEWIAATDWRSSALGPLDGWPKLLKRNVQLCLESRWPSALIWGPQRLALYNDPFLELCGENHPAALGHDFQHCWTAAWPVLGPLLKRAEQGDGCFIEDLRLLSSRGGTRTETFLTLAFSPVRDDGSTIVGVLHSVIETTAKVLSARRSHLLSCVVAASARAVSPRQALELSAQALAEGSPDVPFVIVYGIDTTGQVAELFTHTRSAPEHSHPSRIDFELDPAPAGWPLADVVHSSRPRLLTDLRQRFDDPARPHDADAPHSAFLLPMLLPGEVTPFAVLIAGVNPACALDDEYQAFFERLAAALSLGVSSGRAHEEQRRRAERRGALETSKSTFFSGLHRDPRPVETGADQQPALTPAQAALMRERPEVEPARGHREWAEHLEQANQELEAFSYSVSHDLRTPLRAIDGFTKAILTQKSSQLDDEAKQYLSRVRKATSRMAELIDQLLNLSRVSRAPLHRQLVSLTDLAQQVASSLNEQQPTRRVGFDVEPNVTAHADARLLQIALENLLENAWKFTSGRADAKVRLGQLASAEPGTYFVIDNGAGFDPRYAHLLFQPFQRLHADRDFPGTGVGLAIVNRIVKRHGGRIWAEGHEQRGAAFYFTLSSSSA